MKIPSSAALTLCMLTGLAQQSQASAAKVGSHVELGVSAGIAQSFSGQADVHASRLVGPLGARFSAALTPKADGIRDDSVLTPGSPTFGELKKLGATESGRHTVLGLDATYSLGELAPGLDLYGYLGGRYALLHASVSYMGKTINADSRSLGFGGGLQGSYALAGNLRLTADLGVDHYLDGPLHMTAPGVDETVNPKDTGYKELRSPLAFPGTVFKGRVGVKMIF